MKEAKVLLSIIIFGLTMNLSASVRINGLGSYFEYLIPDTETDIELFPSHLSEFESKFVQIINNGYPKRYEDFNASNINFSIMPLSSKLSFRINADIASNNDGPRIYLENGYGRHANPSYFDGSEYGIALVTNSLSYELTDNFLLGCFAKYGVNWKETDHNRLRIEDPDLVTYEDYEAIEYDDEFISTGINFKFLSNSNTDISLLYSKHNIEDQHLYRRFIERLFSANEEVIGDVALDEDSLIFESETEDMGISILLETKNINTVNRYFVESHYIKQLTEFSDEDFSEDSRYEDDELTRYRKRMFENKQNEDMELYTVTMGFGKVINKQKLEIFYGLKLFGMYAETVRDESYNSFEYYQNIDPDTTYTDSTSGSGENNFKIKDWKAAIEVPFGVSYKLNETVKFNGGMGLKLIRQELEYFENNEFSRWGTDRYVAFGTTISPLECLKCDVNFRYDFANFNSWQIDLKYLW